MMTWATGNARRGFTLIELLLVLTLLAAVMAFTLPSLNGYSKRLAQKTSVDRIRSSLLQARRQAIETGDVVQWTESQLFNQSSDLRLQISPSGPITFFPSGVCSEASIQLVDERNVVFASLGCSSATGNVLTLSPP